MSHDDKQHQGQVKQEILDLFARYGSGQYEPTAAECQIIDAGLDEILFGGRNGALPSHVRRTDWIATDEALPDENRKLLVTNNLHAMDAFGRMSHLWLIGLLQEMDDPEGGYCGYSGDDLIQNITHWRYAPDEAIT